MTAPLKHAVFLSGAFGAALHVLPLATPSHHAVNIEDLRTLIEDATASEANAPSITLPDVHIAGTEDILDYVATNDIDLVTTDTPEGGKPIPPLADATTIFLVKRLNLPLFLTGHLEDPAAIDRIVVPTDFSAHALDAFRHAAALAYVYDVPLDVVHVIESIPYIALTRTDRLSLGPTSLSEHRCKRQINAFLREAHAGDVATRTHVAYGDPAERITEFADKDDGTLLVMSSHGTANQPDQPLGTVAKRTLLQTTRPVLLLRAFGPSLVDESPPFDQEDIPTADKK